jgi:hypothetical protein
MDRRLFGLAAATAVAVFAGACDQAPPSAPQDGPAFKPVPTVSVACAFTGNPSLGNAINAYFTVAADKKTANDYAALMQAGFGTTSNYGGARDPGYDLLSLLGKVSRQGTGASPAAGGSVAQQAIQCMFNVGEALGAGQDFFEWPSNNQFDFASSLNPALGGAWYVRGKAAVDAEQPAIANLASRNTIADPAGGNLSALSPPIFPTAYSWNQILVQNQAQTATRTLVYGEPTTSGYDWKLIPRTVKFSPYAVVALCQGLRPVGQQFLSTELVHQQDVGVLGAPNIGTLCGTAPPLAMLDAQWGRFALIGQLARAANRFFAPQELAAASVLTGTGGSLCCAKSSEFTAEDVPTVQLDIVPNSLTLGPTIKVNTGRFGLAIKVSTPPDPVGGVKVVLSIVNNSGPTHINEVTPAGLVAHYPGCDLNATVPGPNNTTVSAVVPAEEITLGVVSPDGSANQTTIASWPGNLCIDKTGTATVIASSVSDGNSQAAKGQITVGSTTVKGQ